MSKQLSVISNPLSVVRGQATGYWSLVTAYYLPAVLLIYLLLAWGYGVVNPLFEAPDEHHHYFTAEYIAENWQLPFVGDEPDGLMMQEAAQPPLYYVLAALVIAPLDTAGSREQVWFNPRVRLGDASAPDNINTFVHTAAEGWPWQGYALAAHLLRGLTALFGLGTLLCLYAAGRLIWPAEPERAALATALVAFLPQFAFLHASVSNDPLVIFLCAAALWQLLRLWYRGVSRPRLFLLGITIGLAALTKNQGTLLLVFAGGVLFLLAWRDRKWGLLVEAAVWVLLPAVLLAGWLWWRNWMLYGDPTASNQFVLIAGGDRNYSLGQVLSESSGLYRSLFAVFGWMNVRPPVWVYWVWDGLVVAAVLGVVYGWAGKVRQLSLPSHTPTLWLALWLLLVYTGLVFFMMQTPAAQGRLVYPALLPLALAFAYGLSLYRRRWLYWAAPLLALATSLYSLLVVIPHAYARPPLMSEVEITAEARQHLANMGQGLELVASQVETTEVQPGGWVWLTLYWRTEAPPAEPPQYVLELFGRERTLIAKIQGYHGGGRYPATEWPAGQIVADRVGVRVDNEVIAPVQAIIAVRLVNGETSVDVGAVKVAPAEWPDPAGLALAELEGIQLTQVTPAATELTAGEGFTVTVQWHVLTPPGRDLTAFVHLGDPTQAPLAQGDSPPLDGEYPTYLWTAGEVINDAYYVLLPADLPPGRYPLQLGLYDPAGGGRVPLVVDGERQPHDAYPIGWITVGS
jgi:4-amino-4-deoxy-L-arabinose transferase-like glycosyltransferase